MYFGEGKGWVKYVDKKDLWKYLKYEGEIKNGKPHGDGTWKCGFMFFMLESLWTVICLVKELNIMLKVGG